MGRGSSGRRIGRRSSKRPGVARRSYGIQSQGHTLNREHGKSLLHSPRTLHRWKVAQEFMADRCWVENEVKQSESTNLFTPLRKREIELSAKLQRCSRLAPAQTNNKNKKKTLCNHFPLLFCHWQSLSVCVYAREWRGSGRGCQNS